MIVRQLLDSLTPAFPEAWTDLPIDEAGLQGYRKSPVERLTEARSGRLNDVHQVEIFLGQIHWFTADNNVIMSSGMARDEEVEGQEGLKPLAASALHLDDPTFLEPVGVGNGGPVQ